MVAGEVVVGEPVAAAPCSTPSGLRIDATKALRFRAMQGRSSSRSSTRRLRLIVVGAVHIAQALVPMASLTGYDVTVVDPRRGFANDVRFPGVEMRTDWPDEALEELGLDERTAVVTLTHDPKLDDPALDVALRSEAFYIAALGSRRTHAARLERLGALGHDQPTLARIHGPAGLAIGAVSPAEVALSVMAEMTAVLRLEPAGMRFGDLPLAEAEGAILAHSVKSGKLAFRKGRRLSADDLAALAAAGVTSVIAARLGPDDVHEDEAARLLAEAAAGAHLRVDKPFTGRVNLFAEQAGLLVLDRARIDRLNLVDEAVTIATLAAFEPVQPEQMVATVKIIPFAVERRSARALHRDRGRGRTADQGRPLSPSGRRADPDPAAERRAKVLDKTVAITADRVRGDRRPPDRRGALRRMRPKRWPSASRQSNGDILLIAGASAITDRKRRAAGRRSRPRAGVVEHFGMPVDPGQSAAAGQARRPPGAGAAGLLPLAQAERLRLGAAADRRRHRGQPAGTSWAWAWAAC